MSEVTPQAILVNARFGPLMPFLFAAKASESLGQQAAALFESVSRTMKARGGWLLENLVDGGSPKGFASLMERRAQGDLPWEKVSPLGPKLGQAGLALPALSCRKPYSMLARAGYPCWAANGHLYSLDIFNPANELMFPYEEHEQRLWAVIPWPPRLMMSDALITELLGDAAVALNATYGFGGLWVKEAAMAYVFPDDFEPLPAGTRLAGLVYPTVVVPQSDLTAQGLEVLARGVTVGSRHWQVAVLRELAGGRYVLLSTVADYCDENVHVGRLIASVLGKTYVSDLLVKR